MKRLLPVFIIFYLSLLSSVIAREQVTFQHFSVENGLSQNTVMAIMQDRKGFMWFGTWDGLNKFDGYEFTIYKSFPGDLSNIATNRIDLIHEDKHGFIWIQTYDGKFHRFNPKTEQFFSLPMISNRYAYGVERKKRFFESSTGDIWIGTDDLGAIRASIKPGSEEVSITEYSTFSENKIQSNCINFIFEDKNGDIWLGSQNGLYSINPATNQVRNPQPNDGSGSNSFTAGLEMDNYLFFGDNNGSVWMLDKKKNLFARIKLTGARNITDIKSVNKSAVVITTENAGFFVYHLKTGQLSNFNQQNTAFLKTNHFKSVIVDSYQVAWLEAESEGVIRYRHSDQSVKHFQPLTDAVSRVSVLPNFLVIEDVNKKLWINPQGGGFSLYNREKDQLEYFYNRPGSADYKFSNVIHSAYSDNKGNLWLCTYNKGLERISFYTRKFEILKVNKRVKTITSDEVRAVYELNNSNIIVATKDGSIRFFDKTLREIGLLDANGAVNERGSLNDLAYCMLEDSKRNIWIGTKGTGLIKLIPENNDQQNPKYKLERFRYNRLDNNSLSNDNIYSIIEDQEGRILIGTFGGGLNIVSEQHGQTIFLSYRNKLSSYPINSCSKIRHLLQDHQKTIWVATTNGLLQIENFMTPEMKEYYIEKKANERTSLGNNDVHFLHESKDKSLWIGTFGGGLSRLSRKAGDNQSATFETFTTKEGLYSDIVLSIREDMMQNLWISSENSITRFSIRQKVFQNYEIFHDVNDAHFSEAASLFSKSGVMMFGSNKGVVYFRPSNINQSKEIPPLNFTRFQLFNQDVIIGAKNSPLKQSIGFTDEIRLTHRQTVFSIEYAAIDFSNPDKIKYAFMLENFETDWNYVQKQRKATYTNLPKGTYYFKVKSTNAEGVWLENEKTIKIVILPSFWETIYAQILYVVFFLLILYTVYYVTRRIARLKHDVEIEHKVSDIKLRFFTNISHELRTPLTLITGPIENIMKNEKISESVNDQLKVVQSNAERMLRMINQILDFRKIQNKKMRLQIQQTRIDTLVSGICDNFSKEAQDKKINFVFTNHANGALLWIDRDKTDMIVYNLLSNAFKFTPEGKKIEVRLIKFQDHVKIRVSDEGVGIPREKRNMLFERFVSANEIQSLSKRPGSGIGLNLVKELVDLHKGTIEVDSEPGKGTIFTVVFHKGKEHFGDDVDFVISDDCNDQEQAAKTEINSDNAPCKDLQGDGNEINIHKKDTPLLLIVEDNEEMREFLRKILWKKYRIELASDGREGLEKALTLIPDLIITDLMMPVMDGLQLTEQVKMHKDTNHIPVVLLTAKSAVESRLDAMKYGADDYITKPFSPVLLDARIENIIEQRKKLQETFRRRLMELEPKQVEIVSQDEVFIARLLDFMDRNIENSDLTVDEMVSEMAMGRTVFFNKLKNLTGLAPIEFIRELRIKRAAQLLKTGDYNVSQITYMVGMSDSRYFSKCFKKVYGVTPSEYKKSLQE